MAGGATGAAGMGRGTGIGGGGAGTGLATERSLSRSRFAPRRRWRAAFGATTRAGGTAAGGVSMTLGDEAADVATTALRGGSGIADAGTGAFSGSATGATCTDGGDGESP